MKRNSFIVKFFTVAMLIGFYSPSVEIQTSHVNNDASISLDNISMISLESISLSFINEAEARPARRGARRTGRRSGRRAGRRSGARVSHAYHRYPSGFYRGGGYYHRGVYHPVAAWTMVTLSALAIGSAISSSSMSKECTSTNVNNITYKVCDGTWFKPYYDGDSLEYKVVSKP